MFLSKILIHSRIIIHYIVEENIFRQCLRAFNSEERLKCHVKDFFKVNGKPKIGGYIRFKNFKSILVPKDNREKNLVSFILTNIKNMLPVVVATN